MWGRLTMSDWQSWGAALLQPLLVWQCTTNTQSMLPTSKESKQWNRQQKIKYIKSQPRQLAAQCGTSAQTSIKWSTKNQARPDCKFKVSHQFMQSSTPLRIWIPKHPNHSIWYNNHFILCLYYQWISCSHPLDIESNIENVINQNENRVSWPSAEP